MGSTGCLGSFIAGKLIDNASCKADLGEARRSAYVDLQITEPEMLEVAWDGPTRAADCDVAAGLGGEDGVFVVFDEVDGLTSVGFILGEDGGGLQGQVPTLLVIDREQDGDDETLLFWAGLECSTEVSNFEDLGNGYAFVEGHGTCSTIPLSDDEEPKLAAEYGFGNIVLVDIWAASAHCC